jgi:hypothetical protein
VLAAERRSRANSHRLTLLRGTPGLQRVFAISGVEPLLAFAD